jgi:Tetratricopeptide repeat
MLRRGWDWLAAADTRWLLLITSRMVDTHVWGWHGRLQLVGYLDEQDGALMLLNLAPHAGAEQAAMALSRRLGGLPLALHHAGSYLDSAFTAEHSFAAYQDALAARFPQIMGEGAGPRSVVTTTWEISLDALAAGGRPQARPLLRVLSCFEPSVEISLDMLNRNILAVVCDRSDPADVGDGLQALLSVGLLETRHESGSDPPSVLIHPLVADTSRMRLDGKVTGVAAKLLEEATLRLDGASPRDWPAWLAVLPHLRSMFRLPAATIDDQGLIALAHTAARMCFAMNWSGAHVVAGELASTARDAAVTRFGQEHEAILTLRCHHAISSRYLGRYREAESELREVLSAQRMLLGADDPATLATQQEAARVVANLGRYAESEMACREVLAARQRVLGPDNLDTLITRHYLARAMTEQGRYAESQASSSVSVAAVAS